MINHNFVIYKTVYYDTLSQTYSSILVMDCVPPGTLGGLVTSIKLLPVSRNKINTSHICCYAIKKHDQSGFYEYNDLAYLIVYLLNNNYSIDHEINIESNFNQNKKPVLFLKLNL